MPQGQAVLGDEELEPAALVRHVQHGGALQEESHVAAKHMDAVPQIGVQHGEAGRRLGQRAHQAHGPELCCAALGEVHPQRVQLHFWLVLEQRQHGCAVCVQKWSPTGVIQRRD
jgi:hypothetical protein